MMRMLAILVCLSLPFFGGCKPHTEITRWYDQAKWEDAKYDFVKVSIFSKNTPAARSLALISQLTPEGQAAFITQSNI